MEVVTLMLPEKPFVSVVIINWNRKDDIRDTLQKMSGQSYKNFEIIVVDNNSTDGAPEMIEKFFPRVYLIKLPRNLGIEGYNIAIKNARGEIIVILDNDSFLEEDGIQKIVDKFNEFPKLGALGCKVKNYYTKKTHHWHPFVNSEDGPPGGYDAPLVNGCAAAARKDVLDEVGYYPEEFFLYENERDLCTRIVNRGYDVKYFLDILGYHKVSPTARDTGRKTYCLTRNNIWYFLRYAPLWIAVWKIGRVLAGQFIRSLQSRTTGSWFMAIFDAVLGVPAVLRKREVVKKEYRKLLLY